MLNLMSSGLGPGEDDLLVYLLKGTSAVVGPEFFAELVRHLCFALDVAGAWVTELSPDRKTLSAYAFWFQDHYIRDYEYAVEGTPCEAVIESCSLCHVPDNVVQLYPRDPDLAALHAVSYLGLPLVDRCGGIMGHLGVLDVKPLLLTPRLEAVFRIFGARAAAESERLRAERQLQEREAELAALFDAVGEAILILSANGCVQKANRRCSEKFGIPVEELPGRDFQSLLSPASRSKWASALGYVASGAQEAVHAWVAGLEACPPNGDPFPAEAGLACFERAGRRYCTVVLRDVREQREAEKQIAALLEESQRLRRELDEARPLGRLVGNSPPMRRLFQQLRQVAPTDATVLIQGESGTGKELVARAIHDASRRAARPLVRVNCGAIPAALVESEFFGHERGAFTGAADRREGRFALADGGTLFLDEVGELPLDLQVKLLRVLQEGEFEPVGSSRTRKVDVRIIAATNRDLSREVEEGRFRADLYYRLNIFPVHVPPLRERTGDIPMLADALLAKLRARFGRPFAPLSEACLDRLRAYPWPGNVRELENVLERAAILARGNELNIDAGPLPAPSAAGCLQTGDARDVVLTAEELRQLEKRNLVRALESCSWRVSGPSGAARLLGMPPSTLTSRMKALGLQRPR